MSDSLASHTITVRQLLACFATSIVIASTPANGDEKKPNYSQFGIADGEFYPIETSVSHQITLYEDEDIGLHFFPDASISVLSPAPEMRLLVTATYSSWLVEGTDIESLETAREVLTPGKASDFDNGYAGFSGAWQDPDNNTWYGIYHGEDHHDMPTIPTNSISGFYSKIGLAKSTDDGITWEKLGPILSSPKSKKYNAFPDHNGKGVATPGVVASRNGRYLYTYYSDISNIKKRGLGISVARAEVSKKAPLPGNWYKYYRGKFSQPGLAGKDSLILGPKDITGIKNTNDASLFQPVVVYSKTLDRYIMIFCVSLWSENMHADKADKSGLYISFSNDALHWSTPTMLVRDFTLAHYQKSLSWEPSLILDPTDDTHGWLIYGHTPEWFKGGSKNMGHYMVGRRIQFSAEKQDVHLPAIMEPTLEPLDEMLR